MCITYFLIFLLPEENILFSILIKVIHTYRFYKRIDALYNFEICYKYKSNINSLTIVFNGNDSNGYVITISRFKFYYSRLFKIKINKIWFSFSNEYKERRLFSYLTYTRQITNKLKITTPIIHVPLLYVSCISEKHTVSIHSFYRKRITLSFAIKMSKNFKLHICGYDPYLILIQ